MIRLLIIFPEHHYNATPVKNRNKTGDQHLTLILSLTSLRLQMLRGQKHSEDCSCFPTSTAPCWGFTCTCCNSSLGPVRSKLTSRFNLARLDTRKLKVDCSEIPTYRTNSVQTGSCLICQPQTCDRSCDVNKSADLSKVQSVFLVRDDLSESSFGLHHLNRSAHDETIRLHCECERLWLPLHLQSQSEAHVALPARREGHWQWQPATTEVTTVNTHSIRSESTCDLLTKLEYLKFLSHLAQVMNTHF